MTVVRTTPQDLTAHRQRQGELLGRIARMQRTLQTPKRWSIVRPFRAMGGHTNSGYYEALTSLCDDGLVITTPNRTEEAMTYRLTAKGWDQMGGKPLWIGET